MRPWAKAILYALTAFAVGLHFAQTLQWVAAAPNPWIFNDFPIRWYDVEAARAFFHNNHTLWGYDPNFMAGYPHTFVWNTYVAVQAIGVLLPSLSSAAIIKLTFVFSVLAFPMIFYSTLRNFGLSLHESLLGSVAGLIYFRLGLPMLVHIGGMVTAGFAIYFALYSLSCLYRYSRDGELPWAAAFGVTFALALLVHKTSPIMIGVPVAALAIAGISQKKSGVITAVVLSFIFAFFANAFWLVPYLEHSVYYMYVPEAPFWENHDLLRPIKDYFTPVARFNITDINGLFGAVHAAMSLAILSAGIYGIALWRRDRRDARYTAFAAGAAFLFLFGYYGAFIPVGAWTLPTRLLSTMSLMLIIPAVYAAAAHLKQSGVVHELSIVIGPIICGGLLIYSFAWLQPFGKLLAMGIPDDVRALAVNLGAIRDDNGRILIEDSGVMDREGHGQQYGVSQSLNMFPLWTAKEFIGGPYPYMNHTYHKVEFHDARFMGRELEEWTTEELLKRFWFYDINRIVCWSSRCKGYFDRAPETFAFAGEVGRFRQYRTNVKTNRFLQGAGEARAEFGRIYLQNVRPESGQIVLKYHWAPGLRAVPVGAIVRVPIPGDPIGFIGVRHPPGELTIFGP